MSQGAVLTARALRKAFGKRAVVREVSFVVQPGQIVGLLGPNGAGKTTSFNMVTGLCAPDGGEVTLGTASLGALPLYRRARLGLGYLPQEPTVLRGLSAHANIDVALHLCGHPARTRQAHVARILDEAQLSHVAQVPGGLLSGGERRRLEIARVLILKPKVLLLDEPFAGVDPIAVGALQATIRTISQAGIGVLITDHNVKETLRLCDRAYLMGGGTIMAEGTPAQIVGDARVRAVYLGEHFSL